MDRRPVYRFGGHEFDPEKRTLTREGFDVHLEPIAHRLLVYLIENRDHLVTRQELMDTVWGDTVISDTTLSKAVERLRKALGDTPAVPRFIETVHSQGYRFIAEVSESDQKATTDQPTRESLTLKPLHAMLIAVVAVLAMILGYLFWHGTVERDGQHPDEIDSIAVLPLKNLTGDSAQDYMAYGLQDTLTTELGRIRELRVTSFQSTMRYRGSNQALPEIAAELGVDALVEGSLLQIGERIEVNLQLIDGRSDEHLWAQHFEREIPYSFDLLTDAANAIASEIGLRKVDDSTGPIDPRASQAYWMGLDQMSRLSPTGLASAIDHFRTATEIEPQFGLAWGNLAAAHSLQGAVGFSPPSDSMEKAWLAAQKATQAGNPPSIGFSALGWVRFWNQDLRGGCKAFREALRINPSAPFAIHGDADCLLHEGRMEESLERLRELTLIVPFSFVHQLPLCYHLFLARRYDEAVEVALSIRERFPNSPVHVNLSQIYWQQGQYEKALQEERRKFVLYKDSELTKLFDEKRASASPQELMRIIAEALVERSDASYVDAFKIGEAFARAGSADEAIYWLTRAVEQKSFEAVHIPFRPDFDGLRNDPRFNALERRIALNPIE